MLRARAGAHPPGKGPLKLIIIIIIIIMIIIILIMIIIIIILILILMITIIIIIIILPLLRDQALESSAELSYDLASLCRVACCFICCSFL